MAAAETLTEAEKLAKEFVGLERCFDPNTLRKGYPINRRYYRDALNTVLSKTLAHPFYIRLVVYEAVMEPPPYSELTLKDRLNNLYGIDINARNFGICHPDTCLDGQRNFYQRHIYLIRDRMGCNIGPQIQNPLSGEELRELESFLGIEEKPLN